MDTSNDLLRVAGPASEPSGPYNQQAWWIPVAVEGGSTFLLESCMYRPSGDGPFPLVTINHGVPRDESDVNRKKIELRFSAAAQWFVDQGFAAVISLRRGFGKSEGDFSEASGPCDNRDYIAEGKATAADMLEVIRYLKKQNFIDSKRIIIVGQSGGGLGALTIATNPPEGVLGVASFAGARGSKEPGMVCSENSLVSAMAVLGTLNKLPSIWLFSENDHYFGPSLAQKIFSAYSGLSIPEITFVTLPAFGNDGHRTLYDADPDVWSGQVSVFLKKLGF